MLSQLNRIYTLQPPDSQRWARTSSESDAADVDQPVAQGNAARPLVLQTGERVEALFEVEGSRKWFGGVVVTQNANGGSYKVRFDDGEVLDFTGDNHASFAL